MIRGFSCRCFFLCLYVCIYLVHAAFSFDEVGDVNQVAVECSICLETLHSDEGTEKTTAMCAYAKGRHGFHTKCLNKWKTMAIAERRARCPVCSRGEEDDLLTHEYEADVAFAAMGLRSDLLHVLKSGIRTLQEQPLDCLVSALRVRAKIFTQLTHLHRMAEEGPIPTQVTHFDQMLRSGCRTLLQTCLQNHFKHWKQNRLDKAYQELSKLTAYKTRYDYGLQQLLRFEEEFLSVYDSDDLHASYLDVKNAQKPYRREIYLFIQSWYIDLFHELGEQVDQLAQRLKRRPWDRILEWLKIQTCILPKELQVCKDVHLLQRREWYTPGLRFILGDYLRMFENKLNKWWDWHPSMCESAEPVYVPRMIIKALKTQNIIR